MEIFRPAPSMVSALEGGVIRVGTENRAKLGAVRETFARFAEEPERLVVEPSRVSSGVSEQPIGWQEIVSGARNRARAAFDSGECALAIGIEDGLVRLTESAGDANAPGPSAPFGAEVYNFGCAWVTDGSRESHGFSSGFTYPPGCLEPAFRDQRPIGDLFDALWKAKKSGDRGISGPRSGGEEPAKTAPSAGISGRSVGNIGLLTGGRLDRSDYGSHAVMCALVRFLHTDLYD